MENIQVDVVTNGKKDIWKKRGLCDIILYGSLSVTERKTGEIQI